MSEECNLQDVISHIEDVEMSVEDLGNKLDDIESLLRRILREMD